MPGGTPSGIGCMRWIRTSSVGGTSGHEGFGSGQCPDLAFLKHSLPVDAEAEPPIVLALPERGGSFQLGIPAGRLLPARCDKDTADTGWIGHQAGGLARLEAPEWTHLNAMSAFPRGDA